MDEITQETVGKDLNNMSRVDNGSSETTQDEGCIPQKKITAINEIEAEPNVSTNGIDAEETKADNFESLIDLQPVGDGLVLEKNENNEVDVEENFKNELLDDSVEKLFETEGKLNQSERDIKPNNGVSDVEKISDPVPIAPEVEKPLISFDDEDFEKPKSSVSVPEKNCTDNFISILDQSLSVVAEENQNDKISDESKHKSDNSDAVEMVNVSDSNNIDSNLTLECTKDILEDDEKSKTSECEKDALGDEEKSKNLTTECEKDVLGDEEENKNLTTECEQDTLGDEEKNKNLTMECENDALGDEEENKNLTTECEKDALGDAEKNKNLTTECEKDALGDEEKNKNLTTECEKDALGDEEKNKNLTTECEKDALGDVENNKNLTPECEKDISGDEEKCDNESKPEESESENFLNGENQLEDQLKTNEECKDNLDNFEEDKTMETELVSCDDIGMDSSREGNDAESHENPSLDHDKQSQVNLFEEMEIDELNVEKDALEDSEKLDGKEMEVSDDKCTSSNSEVETITGDTNNQNQKEGNNTDEEICIIPDDVSPRSNVANKDKEDNIRKEGEEESEKSGETSTDVDLLVTRGNEKRREYAANKKLKSNGVEVAKSSSTSEVQTEVVAEQLSVAEESNSGMEESSDSSKMCAHCKSVKICKFQFAQASQIHNLCSDQCYNAFKEISQSETELNESISAEPFGRRCAQCRLEVTGDDKCLSWETMDFCDEDCLRKYQNALGAYCANCKTGVATASMGKYCVRFGYEIRQFCSSSCLEEYKKGLKFCSYCQKDISAGTGFLAPVGDQGQFKDFCEQSCMEKYERMGSNSAPPDVIEECAVCSNSKPVRVEVELDNKTQKLCSEPCFAAFKFVNNIREGQCDMCKKYFDRTKKENFSIYYEDSFHLFCCKTCMNVYILANRKIVPCNRCKVKKYNFDMIKKINSRGQILMMCSLNCLLLYQKMIGQVKCDCCTTYSQSQYHLTMSDGSVKNFCCYTCVISFQNRFPKQTLTLPGDNLSSPVPIGGPKRVLPRRTQAETPCVPVISSVQSLAASNSPIVPSKPRVSISGNDVSIVPQVAQVAPITQTITLQSTPVQTAPAPQVYQQIITKPPQPKEVKNKALLCKPYTFTKGVSCRPHPCMKETQTDESLNRKCLIPIPVPIFIPAPMHMYASPYPVPVPFPLPIPVPIFIPTTRNSAKGIFKEIKKIQEKIPTDPFEAELLMMAEMVAGDKKQDPTDSESEEGNDADEGPENTFSPENVDTSNTFGDDMLQMALKMASELEEPAVDMESVLTSNTITPTSQPPVDPNKNLYAADPDDPDQVPVMMNRGRKRAIRGGRNSSGNPQSKRGRRTSGSVDVPMLPPPEPVPPPRIEVEKPDANMCLKYTFGVNAWRHWVMQKNAELEKAALTNRKIKLFKPELLQLTADELNFSLCLFVKEVRKPNGTEYAPDTIYYLCLGIQQYLFENGRIDNIFTDSYYEKFTDCLDEVAKKFAALYNDSQYIVTRVEEEHLWESKQLGAHSPHVLLSTLMFFNTKHFNLVTVEEHMQLSFSHIMKHWKRNPNAPGVAKVPGSRNVLLRFYPPQSALEANSRKKKVYEQQENEENPLRCPVKLYEFYLSKCPESVKTRNDVFYLLPERSCVPDSPVWYSTMALGKEPLMKMLHRVKMVKEINIALLTC